MQARRTRKLIARCPLEPGIEKIKLREFRPRDHKNLLRMYAQFRLEDTAFGIPPVKRASRRRWIENLEQVGLNVVALSGRRIVGHASIIDAPEEDFCEFIFFVHPDFRGRGIGTSLARAICYRALCLGKSRIWIVIERKNEEAVKAMHRIGFRVSGVYDGEYEMELDLEPVSAIFCM